MQEVQKKVVEATLKHADVTMENFQKSIVRMMQDVTFRLQGQKVETDLMKGDPVVEFAESREELKIIFLEKSKAEFLLNLRLSKINYPNPAQKMQQQTVENTKIQDGIFVKYGVRVQYLMQANDRFGFSEDEDFKNLGKAI